MEGRSREERMITARPGMVDDMGREMEEMVEMVEMDVPPESSDVEGVTESTDEEGEARAEDCQGRGERAKSGGK